MDEHEKVRQRAYELYVKNGRREGRDLLDWLAAEQIVRFERIILPVDRGIELLEYKPGPRAVVDSTVVPSARRKIKPRAGAGGR